MTAARVYLDCFWGFFPVRESAALYYRLSIEWKFLMIVFLVLIFFLFYIFMHWIFARGDQAALVSKTPVVPGGNSECILIPQQTCVCQSKTIEPGVTLMRRWRCAGCYLQLSSLWQLLVPSLPCKKKKNYKWSAEPSGLYVFKGVENVILALNLSLNHRLLCTKSVLMN